MHALVTCPGMGRGKGAFTLATDKRSAGARPGPKSVHLYKSEGLEQLVSTGEAFRLL